MFTIHNTCEGVFFDDKKIAPETVSALLDMGNSVDDRVMLGTKVLEAYKGLEIQENAPLTMSQDEVHKLVIQTLAEMQSDPDLDADLSKQNAQEVEKLKDGLSAALMEGLAKNNEEASNNSAEYSQQLKEFFHFKEGDDSTDVYMNGELVMQVSGANQAPTRKAIQAFFVVLDVLFLVYAILSMPQCKPAKKAIEDLIRKFGAKISHAANSFISALSGVFSKLQSAHSDGSSAFVTAVKNAAKTIGNGVVHCVNVIWDKRKGLALLKDLTLAVFQAAMGSVWKALYYIGQFVLGVISLIAGPAAMAAKVANLLSALASLIVDSIELANMSTKNLNHELA